MTSQLAITKAPSMTKYLVPDSSHLLAQARLNRARQIETITRPRARGHNSELRRAIAVALSTGYSTK